MTTTPLHRPTFRERYAAARADIDQRHAEKVHAKHLRKALRRQGNLPVLTTTTSTWTEAQDLLRMGWELESSQRNQWNGSDMPGRSAVLTWRNR